MRPHFIPSIIVALGIVFFVTPASASFADVPLSHPYKEAIEYIQAEGIVQGYSDGTFRPDQTINRAEFVKILAMAHRLLSFEQSIRTSVEQGLPTPPPESDWTKGPLCGFVNRFDSICDVFSDLCREAWFNDYICYAYDQKWIEGYPDGTFKPGNTINFAESAKIIANVFGLQSGTGLDPWYRGYVTALAGENVIPLSITSFDQSITRGEMAEMIYRLREGGATHSSRTYEELAWITDPWTSYTSETFGISFSYPNAWNDPVHRITPVIDFGPVCKNCAEGTDTSIMNIEPESPELAQEAVARLYRLLNDPQSLISNVRETSHNGLRIVTWDEGGICGFHSAYVIGNTAAVAISGFCLADDPLLSGLLDRIALTVRLLQPSQAHYKEFDACGLVFSYADRSWFPSFIKRVAALGLRVEDDLTFSEGCLALDGSMFLAIWSGDYCEGSRVFRYDIATNRLDEAIRENALRCESIRNFGKRSGAIIPLTGTFGDAGCSATYYYDYDFVRNTVRKTKSQSQCADDLQPEWQYFQ